MHSKNYMSNSHLPNIITMIICSKIVVCEIDCIITVLVSSCEGHMTMCEGHMTMCESHMTMCEGHLTMCEGHMTVCESHMTMCVCTSQLFCHILC